MAIKALLKTLDGLDESIKSLYVKRDDAYVLDVDDVDSHPNVRGLVSTLAKQKDDIKSLKENLSAFGGMTGEELAALKAKAATQSVALHINGKDVKTREDLVPIVEEMLKDRVAEATKEWGKERTTLVAEKEKYRERLSAKEIDALILDAGAKVGVRSTAIPDLLARAKQYWRLTDDGAVPMDGDKVIYGKDPSKPMTSEEWVAKLAEQAPHLFNPNTGAGAGGGAGSGAGGAKTLTRKAFNALTPAEQSKAAKEYSITDA